jgi:hypothetical protein
MEIIVKWNNNYDKIDCSKLTITANSKSYPDNNFEEATVPLSGVDAYPWSAILLGEVLDTGLTLKEFLKANYPEALL